MYSDSLRKLHPIEQEPGQGQGQELGQGQGLIHLDVEVVRMTIF